MAVLKNILIITALLLTTIILETGNFLDQVIQVRGNDDHFLSHSRQKRSESTGQVSYTVEVEVSGLHYETILQLQSLLNATSLPLQLDNSTEITDIQVTTVCSNIEGLIQCQCQRNFAWPQHICDTHFICDAAITNGICTCIRHSSAIGQTCQPISELLNVVEYTVDLELNITDLGTLDELRTLLVNDNLTFTLGPTINVTQIQITTVCFLNSTSFQCRCEDGFAWSITNCRAHGACDEIVDDTCGCINGIPSTGQYCQPKTAVPVDVYEYQLVLQVSVSDADGLVQLLNNLSLPVQIDRQTNISAVSVTTVCGVSDAGTECRCEDGFLWPCEQCSTYGRCGANNTCSCITAFPTDGQFCQSVVTQNITDCPVTTTSPPGLYEYVVSVELNTSEVAINQLRSMLLLTPFPVILDEVLRITSAKISTVCSSTVTGYQCRCEDQHRWSCDQCFLYGPCDNITEDTCGCINAIPPDGRYCQSADQHNFTACPVTTSPSPTTSAAQYEYVVSVEMTIGNETQVNLLRTILRNQVYPVAITGQVQLAAANITTVCSQAITGNQCRCEDQYRWSCDQCFLYGPCDNITGDTCGCINAIPPDGGYCQSADQHNFTSCITTTTTPSPTTPQVVYEYLVSVELNTSDVTVLERLRNLTFPLFFEPAIQVSALDISTVCSPTVTGYQCRCEDQYRWSCDQCFLYGPCDNITGDTCGCINAIPPDGRYCQSADQHNFTSCITTTTTPSPTTPQVLYEYLVSVELNTSDVTVLERLRNLTFPLFFEPAIQVSALDISTVCSPTVTGYQCRCEDQYRWSCDQCFLYGPCDNITGDTCGCINAIPPDGRYCQSADQHNFTACPATTTPTTITTPLPTTPALLYQYLVSVELQILPVVVNRLRIMVVETPYPVSVDNQTQIQDLNISTVCNPRDEGYQCRCENHYRWSCDQCLTYGACDNITGDTCGCINAIPPDGRYCELPSDLPICPTSTPSNNSTGVTPTPTTNVTNTTAEQNTTTVTTPTVTPTPTANVTNSTTNFTTPTSAPTVTNTTAEQNTTTVTTPTVTPTTTANVTNSTTNFTTPTSAPTITNTTTNINTTTVTSTPTANTTNSTPNMTTPTSPVTNTTVTPTPTTNVTIADSTPITTPTSTRTTSITTSPPDVTTPTSPQTTTVTSLTLEMSVELDMTYTEDLNDASSDTYRNLESRINSLLVEVYQETSGFISAGVRRFREGSVIADFAVMMREINPAEVVETNINLSAALQTIAPAGLVSVLYISPTPMIFDNPVYTGQTMILECRVPAFLNVMEVPIFKWKFNGREIKQSARIEIETNSPRVSTLTVKNVILLDAGRFECTLLGQEIDFSQKADVTLNEIIQAPVIRLPLQINVKCLGTAGQTQSLQCCVQSSYKVKWFRDSLVLGSTATTNDGSYCIKYDYPLGTCSQSQPIIFTCRVDNLNYQATTTMTIFTNAVTCNDAQYGSGRIGDKASIGCEKGQQGSKTAVCQDSGNWLLVQDSCIIIKIKELLIDSEDLVVEAVPDFAANLSTTVIEEKAGVANSSASISAVVDIIQNIAEVAPNEVTEAVMKDILETVDVIVGDDSRESWIVLNANETRNASSELLGSLESLSIGLVGEFAFATQLILINRTTFNDSFTANLNNSIIIDIPDTDLTNLFITTITFPTLNNVMPARNSSFDPNLFNATTNSTTNSTTPANTINGAVVIVQVNATIRNVTLRYNKLNDSLLLSPQCVFWNFTIFENLGAWDGKGCTFVSDINNTVTCNCNHLTSFSILMATDIPEDLRVILDVITYVGVGISLASLVICLIIEGFVWKAVTRNSTAFMRHICIVNTALSLLIADICFIIGASIANNPLENPGEDFTVAVGPCSTATFFMHFFYMALFFWMLMSGLLLFYRTVLVFSHMSKSTMLAIGFVFGYGGPLIIAVVTVASTAGGNGYIRRDYACWLNWVQTKALLAMVIPALTIVAINFLIVLVVMFKMLRRGVGDTAQRDEKHTLMVVLRCVIILTPLFGLTWALGVGTMISSTNRGLHIAFAFFNSLQGFFILVFGTLLDSKIRSVLARKAPTSSTGSNNPTRSSSSAPASSSSGLSWLNRLRRRRYIYRVAEAGNSSSAGPSESFMNI